MRFFGPRKTNAVPEDMSTWPMPTCGDKRSHAYQVRHFYHCYSCDIAYEKQKEERLVEKIAQRVVEKMRAGKESNTEADHG